MKTQKGFSPLWIIGAVIVLFIGILVFSSGGIGLPNVGKTDMKDVFYVFKAAPAEFDVDYDVEATCLEREGTWTWESDKVACEGLNTATIDCNSNGFRIFEIQCEGVQGTFTCDPRNIACEY